MRKAIFAIAAAATLAVSTLSVPTPAEARCRGCAAVGIGVGAGLLAGAVIAGSQPRYYAPQPGYVIYNGYGAPYPVSCPGGYWARRPVRDGYGNIVGWSRPRFICP